LSAQLDVLRAADIIENDQQKYIFPMHPLLPIDPLAFLNVLCTLRAESCRRLYILYRLNTVMIVLLFSV